MPFKKLPRTILPLLAALILVPVAAFGADQTPRPPDSAKKRLEREKMFLMRASDDLGRSAASVNEMIVLFKEQYDAIAGREPEDCARERAALRDWYEQYADWLSRMSAEFDADVADFFSGHDSKAWIVRYDEISKGYQKLAGRLSGSMRGQENEKKKIEARLQKLNTAVLERRILIEKDDLEPAKELWPNYRPRPYDAGEAVYKDLTDEETDRFRYELRQLGERKKIFEIILELEHYEANWLNARSDEAAQLYALAGAIESSAPAIMNASRSAIRLYEADSAAFLRKTDELSRKSRDNARTGTIKTLDLLEEQSRYCEKMRTRYESHIEWLKGRIGDYQADLVELTREI